ncbi:uncharacterized protein DUF3489 [Albidovulum inexpectatum]|uniref:Uncharacterized protein DUF3489 n=1 Tax=Albidovulum inexpectatum TaxID=196587 RepID=A0A2S5JIT2_9RHOB|nr:DUF3489 domain-containing protein [Albidovulum inexpectatum]PPB81350.1 uncharacterized protein DUF3489 [Albidovulum inexpectatum]
MPKSPQTKIDTVRSMLARPAGASLAALCKATGWQAHSVRAALSTLRKKGLPIERREGADGKPATWHIPREPEAKS